MKTVMIDTRDETVDEISSKLLGELMFLKEGPWEISIGKPKRSNRLNRTIHAIFAEAATQLEGIGFMIQFGKFEASPTPALIKEFFKQIYLGGKNTSECNSAELADALTTFMRNVNTLLKNSGVEYVVEVREDDIKHLLGAK